MTSNAHSIVILAAGKGTRMKSNLPKVLHEIAGRPMLGHVLANTTFGRDANTVLVVGPDMDEVAAYACSVRQDLSVVVQLNQRGTGDAARTALPEITHEDGVVLVVFGDTPLVRAETLADMSDTCRKSGNIVILGFEAADPTG